MFVQSYSSVRTLRYMPINECICIPPQTRHQRVDYAIAHRARIEGLIIVLLCALYCIVFSAVNET